MFLSSSKLRFPRLSVNGRYNYYAVDREAPAPSSVTLEQGIYTGTRKACESVRMALGSIIYTFQKDNGLAVCEDERGGRRRQGYFSRTEGVPGTPNPHGDRADCARVAKLLTGLDSLSLWEHTGQAVTDANKFKQLFIQELQADGYRVSASKRNPYGWSVLPPLPKHKQKADADGIAYAKERARIEKQMYFLLSTWLTPHYELPRYMRGVIFWQINPDGSVIRHDSDTCDWWKIDGYVHDTGEA